MIIVLDVSAAIEIIFQREKVNTFKHIYNQGTWIIAPDLFIAVSYPILIVFNTFKMELI